MCSRPEEVLHMGCPHLKNPFSAAVLKSAPLGLSSPWESILCSSPEEVLYLVYPHFENTFCSVVLKRCTTCSFLTLRIHSVQQSWRGAPSVLSSPLESILCSSPEDVLHLFCPHLEYIMCSSPEEVLNQVCPHLENPFCAAVLKRCSTWAVLT